MPDPDSSISQRLRGAPGDRLVDTLRETLIEAIFDGQIVTKGRLYPSEIAAKFGVSPTPVREALMRLAAEGFVRAVPRRGFHVNDPTPDEILDLWEVRRGLETLAAELAIERLQAGTASLDELLELEQQLIDSDRKPDALRDHVELNARFHETIIEMSGNGLLMTLFSALRLRLLGIWIKSSHQGWRRRLGGDQAEHRAIVGALEHRDVEAAREAIARHMKRSLTDMIVDLKERAKSEHSVDKRHRRGRM